MFNSVINGFLIRLLLSYKNSYLEQYIFSLVLEGILLNYFLVSVIRISSKFGGVGTDLGEFGIFLVDLNKFFKLSLNTPSTSKYDMIWYVKSELIWLLQK